MIAVVFFEVRKLVDITVHGNPLQTTSTWDHEYVKTLLSNEHIQLIVMLVCHIPEGGYYFPVIIIIYKLSVVLFITIGNYIPLSGQHNIYIFIHSYMRPTALWVSAACDYVWSCLCIKFSFYSQHNPKT